MEQIQAVVDTPICLDSANPVCFGRSYESCRPNAHDQLHQRRAQASGRHPAFSRRKKCQVIALATDEKSIPHASEDRIAIVEKLISKTRDADISDSQVYVDPLVLTIATNTENGRIFFETVRAVGKAFPEVHFTSGLNNISFGLPVRSHITRAFLAIAVEAVLDSAITDPSDKDLMSAIYAAELVAGKDKHCLNYTRSFRAGRFGQHTNFG